MASNRTTPTKVSKGPKREPELRRKLDQIQQDLNHVSRLIQVLSAPVQKQLMANLDVDDKLIITASVLSGKRGC
jgi:hypothetical protein